ncbi:MAG: ribosomal protein large subunit ribosomal protein [Parcubacteria group bacterium]|nr:ribosomal protein large subunit ribosomal protein [Parcubacteria group bacterium]
MTITKTQKGERTLYTIDAAGQSLGRVASEAASALLGKKSPHFMKNEVLPVEVEVVNVSKLLMSERRIAGKAYTRYTQYPGGLITTTMQMLIEKKGIGEVMRKAVDGMIPRNSLRKERMKRLTLVD